MANPYSHRSNVNGHSEKVRYRDQTSHSSTGHSGQTDSRFVNPALLINSEAEQESRSTAEKRPTQSIQIVIPSPSRGASFSNVNPAHTLSTNFSAAAIPPIDYQLLLLSLAEDYFAAARGGGSMLALFQRQPDVMEYQKLIAAGLSCLEASLKHWRLQPLLEARIQLRYAAILYDETDNLDDAEEALSKGIVISDRLRDFDLKYNMQHLLARVLYRGNARVGLKYLDRLINEVEAYQHLVWIYAFRFLRVSLSLECSSHQEAVCALSQLRNIYTTSQQHGDTAVGAVSTTLEALIHLRQSDSAESIEQAQRAIALARRSQLDPAVGSVPAVTALTHIVDICCTLRAFDPNQATAKMQAMQTNIESLREHPLLGDDGSFNVPINHAKGVESKSQNGAVRCGQDGTQFLAFDWIPIQEIYSLGFLVSGVCVAHKNTTDGQKAESMLLEGIRLQEENLTALGQLPQSLSITTSRNLSRLLLKASMHLHLAFVLCTRTAWSLAEEELRILKALKLTLGLNDLDDLSMSVRYLEGVTQQATGNLESALSIFQSPPLAIAQLNKSTSSHLQMELSVVSALNTLLIVRSRPQDHDTIPPLLEYLEPLCTNNPNKSIQTAYNLTIATVSAPDSIVRTKQCLQYALQSAKLCGNKQLLCMTLNFLSWKFFRGVVGEQAEKSARTSHITSKMGMDRLWMSVSAGVLGDTLEIQGRVKEAAAMKEEGRNIASGLPDAVQRVELLQ